jgi:DNA-binding beta-propeller fold protein YncE
MKTLNAWMIAVAAAAATGAAPGAWGDDWPKPYSPPCVERQNEFEFTEKPSVKLVGKDKYEVTFAVKAFCDVAVAVVDPAEELVKGRGTVVRHLGAGVLGPNVPEPFQKNSLKQKIYWNGKDDLDVYHKEPGKLKVRVMLGLKPEFDRNLGATNPKNLPGFVGGIGVGPDAVYVMAVGDHNTIRKFDHDGNYLGTVVPPPANLPAEKLGGYSYVEYEPGKRSPFGPDKSTAIYRGWYMPAGLNTTWSGPLATRPCVAGNRLYVVNNGSSMDSKAGGGAGGHYPHRLYYFHTDGSTDVAGIKGRILLKERRSSKYPMLAASPDEKWIYFVRADHGHGHSPLHAVFRASLKGDDEAEEFVGEKSRPGSDLEHLNVPKDIACDVMGRVYVADGHNNRVQVFSEEGRHLKAIKVSRPRLVQVHRETGVVYVAHDGRLRGRSVGRLTRFSAFPDLKEEQHWDGLAPGTMTLDPYTPRPRLWTSGTRPGLGAVGELRAEGGAYNVVVFEDDGERLVKVVDFLEDVKAEAGANYHGRWSGGAIGNHFALTCDPVRERVYYGNGPIFDLRTGALLGYFRHRGVWSSVQSYGGHVTESMFDRYGYMHCRINRGLGLPKDSGVGRLEPGAARVVKGDAGKESLMIPHVEVPYDYGEESAGWRGAVRIHKTDHRFYNYGFGVNMRGDMAVGLLVEGLGKLALKESAVLNMRGQVSGGYATWIRSLKEQFKRDEDYYPWPRYPGTPRGGGAVITFDRTGELRSQHAVVAGGGIFGVHIDEDGDLYFISRNRNRVPGGLPFLSGKAGCFGTDQKFSFVAANGVYMKTRGDKVRFQCEDSKVVPLSEGEKPRRPADLVSGLGKEKVWVEGAEWVYAGATPAKHLPMGCDCYHLQGHLDWYKRSYVPEVYRHSIGILDTNGNLILHVGGYGNYDSGFGPNSRIPLGGDGVGITFIRFVTATDNYMVFDSWGERLCAVKLDYHAEETAPIRAR